MTRWAIDTNVPVVANGRHDGDRQLDPECREAAIRFLTNVCDKNKKEHIVVDAAGEIVKEYGKKLRPSGQPGVGDRFYRAVLSDWTLCRRVCLPKRPDGEYADLPQDVINARFDPDDRKFAALAKRERVPVVNAVDSDWLDARDVLAENGVRVKLVCGCDKARWFAA